MASRTHLVFKANDRSYFAILKKEIHYLVADARFSDKKIGEIDIIVAETVSNLVKHAGGGEVWVKLIREHDQDGIEILSIDHGIGMTDVSRMVSDGVSTKNTLGHGLGAMKRLSDTFQVYSQKDWGTVILMRVFKEPLQAFRKPSKIEIKSILLPKPGERACGDGFFYAVTPEYIKLFLGDGLGHGVEAEKAVLQAGEAFHEYNGDDPVEMIRHIHESVKKTRGLVGTAVVFDLKEKKWKFCGVGNVMSKLSSPSQTKSHLAYNGIIGLNLPRTLNVQEIEYETGQHLIMCSDGLKTKWDIIRYPAILRYDMSVLTATLLKDFSRQTDDMSVGVCKIN